VLTVKCVTIAWRALHAASSREKKEIHLLDCVVPTFGHVVGNVLVVTAVVVVRRLRTPSNLLIVSLAISDLLVAMLHVQTGLTNNFKQLSSVT